MAKLMLIDGHSLTYRAFFALPADMATTSGQVTNAVFGFTSMLINLLRDHKPDRLAVAFDLPEPTFRHKKYDDYKAGRTAAPDILRQQLGLVRELVDALAVPVLEMPGFEADDIIATLATRAKEAGDDVIVVTGDRDAYQLVEDPHVKVLYNKRGVSDYAFYDEAGIFERTGVYPKDYVHYAALRGDKSDNLEGVPGVGEKTAAKLINKYGGIEGIYEHVDEQTPKLRENLASYRENVDRNLEMMPLVLDVPIEAEIDELQIGGIDAEEVRRLFDFLEFRALYDRLTDVLDFDGGAAMDDIEVIEAEMTVPETPADAVIAVSALPLTGPVGVAGHVGDNGELQGLAVTSDPASGDVLWLSAALLADESVTAAVRETVGSPTIDLCGHDIKPTMRALFDLGIDLPGLAMDTALAAYLLDPAESSYPLDGLLLRFASLQLPDGDSAPEGQLDFGEDTVDDALLTGRRALGIARVVVPIRESLEELGLTKLNTEIEVPLIRVLAKMEHVGVGVDVAELTKMRDDLTAECDRLREATIEAAGEDFNINSTKQLREILFDKLGLTPQKKTKTGYSTDAATLEKLRDDHPMVDLLLQYREVEKLRSTYGEGLVAEVGPGDRIRATFNQTVARTGRLSSDKPNLHNIPVRSERGRNFRRAFVAGDDKTLLIADYNQIELRCIAHLAEDPGLITAFEAGDDIHNATASRVFGVKPEDVTVEQRSKAKMVSYGLAYGMESYGLGQRLGIPTNEAQVILDAYFEAFPAVRQYMDDTVAEARQRGYTETLFGRRRQIPELSSSNFRIRQAGERQAMNAGIQGLAADIFKVALVELDKGLDESSLEAEVILQVHDEVVLEVPPAELDATRDLVVKVMANAFDLRVPLDVNLADGPTWAAGKG
ncbi:MAG: DNA polymerase I [Acidimicrobiales bacterium]